MALKFLSSRYKIVLTVLLGLLTAIAFFWLAHPVASAGFLPLPDASKFGDLPDPEGEGLQKGYNVVFEVIRNFRYIIGAVAILFMVISGVRMVIQGDNEEVAGKQKTNLLWAVIGLVLIAIAGPMAEIFDMQEGGFLSDEYEIGYRARLFDKQVNILIVFIKYILGSVLVLFMVRSGAKLITGGDSEEVLTGEKKNLTAAGVALLLIFMSDIVIKKVLFKVSAPAGEYSAQGQQAVVQIDTGRGVEEIVALTNFVVTWASPIAVLVLIVGAVMYVTSFGDEEQQGKAKKVITNAVIALMIIYGAFAIVSTLVSGVF